MTPSRDDDARAIPQRRPPGDGVDDVYVVDTRGRRGRTTPPPPPVPSSKSAAGRSAGSPADRGGDRPRPAPGSPAPATDPRRRSTAAEQAGADQVRSPTRALPTQPRPGGRSAGQSRPSGPARPVAATGRPRRRRYRLVALLLAVALLAYAAVEIWAPTDAWNHVARVDDTPGGSRPASSSGHNYLLVGSDSRAGLTPAQKKSLGTGSDPGQRTDSIILVHTPGNGGDASLISIPRDSYVPIPGHGSNKINAAFSIGGPKLLIQTVEQATDLRIDGYLEIGFGGFAQLVDSMGGVNICVPFNMDDPKAHINLKKGCQTLDGANALGFVRARYSDPRGDIGRAQRQRQFLAAIMKKMATPSTVLVPWTWWNTSHAAVAGITVGQETSLSDAYRIVQTMRGASSGKTLSLVVPLADLSYQTQAGLAVKWDSARARALFTMLRDGTPMTSPPAGTDGKPSGNTG